MRECENAEGRGVAFIYTHTDLCVVVFLADLGGHLVGEATVSILCVVRRAASNSYET
jgi:hypothetical protein